MSLSNHSIRPILNQDGDEINEELQRKRHSNTDQGSESRQKGSSKYDFIKVNQGLVSFRLLEIHQVLVYIKDHYYVFSRYLICCALVSTKVLPQDAVRISLELKKTLVDSNRLSVTQNELERYLVQVMHLFGYGTLHVARFRMLNR